MQEWYPDAAADDPPSQQIGNGLVLQEEYLVVFHYLIERSCRFSIVMIEESAEPLAWDDPAWLSFWNALDQPIAATLMGSLAVVVLHVLRDRAPQMPLAEDD